MEFEQISARPIKTEQLFDIILNAFSGYQKDLIVLGKLCTLLYCHTRNFSCFPSVQ